MSFERAGSDPLPFFISVLYNRSAAGGHNVRLEGDATHASVFWYTLRTSPLFLFCSVNSFFMDNETFQAGDPVVRVRHYKHGPGIPGLIGRQGTVLFVAADQARVQWNKEADGSPLNIRSWVKLVTLAKIKPGQDIGQALASAG